MGVRRKRGGGASKTKRDKQGFPKRNPSNVPDEYDEILRQQNLETLGKGLDENGKPKPITEKQIVALAVKAIRNKWMSCPSKLHFLESQMIWDTDPKTRTLKLWECNQCEGRFKLDEINVDHIRASGSCTSLEELPQWAESQLNAGGEEDLQILCIPCHEVKNIMDSYGITNWEHGRELKNVIVKLKTSGYDKQWLKEHDVEPASNAKLRKQQIIKTLEAEYD